MPGIIGFYSFDDQCFRRQIGLGHKINIAFFRDIYLPAELFKKDLSRIACGFDCKIEHSLIFNAKSPRRKVAKKEKSGKTTG